MAVEITAPPDERRGEEHMHRHTIREGDSLVFDSGCKIYRRARNGHVFPRTIWGNPIMLRIGETSLETITLIVANPEGALITVDGNGFCGTQIRIANGSPILHAFGGVDIQVRCALQV